jgi:hypothetical protein
MIEFLLTYSNGLSYTQNERRTWKCHFQSYWKCLEDFFVLHIFQLEKMIGYWIVLNRTAVGSSTKAIWTNSYSESEKSSKHFQYDGKWHCHVGCSFWV